MELKRNIAACSNTHDQYLVWVFHLLTISVRLYEHEEDFSRIEYNLFVFLNNLILLNIFLENYDSELQNMTDFLS